MDVKELETRMSKLGSDINALIKTFETDTSFGISDIQTQTVYTFGRTPSVILSLTAESARGLQFKHR